MSLHLSKGGDNRTAFTCARCGYTWPTPGKTHKATSWHDRFRWVGSDALYCSEDCADKCRPPRDELKAQMVALLSRAIDVIYDDPYEVVGRSGLALWQLDEFWKEIKRGPGSR